MSPPSRWTIAALLLATLAGCSGGGSGHPSSRSPKPKAASLTPNSTPTPTLASTAPRSSGAPSSVAHSPVARSSARPTHHTRTSTGSRATGRPLPLHLTTGSARQVVTVVAPSTGSTRAVLQTWRKVADGWRRVGPAVPAWLGSDGLSKQPSESRSATPIGSFTLTQAFGHDPDPGTSLPYAHTTPADWWISQPGPLYNTRQRCASGCPFTRGDPNEHLYYETPYYDYAAVIDYNTRNAPGGVRQGAGSAFFLHVTVGQPTAGCVSIAKAELVRILRWLMPGKHPRILIGVA